MREALEHVLDSFTKEELISLILTDLDIRPELEEYFYDDIADYHESVAWDEYREFQAAERDPFGYHGMSKRDFI